VTILYVDHGEGLGGAEHSLLLLMSRLDRGRFRPLLACDGMPLASAARTRGITACEIAIPQLRGHPAAVTRLWRSSRELARLARREDAAVLHSNTMRASLGTALAARGVGRPLVWHARDLYGPSRIGGRWYPWLMSRLADCVIANSAAVARTIPHSEVRVVYNAVEIERFDPSLPPRAARRRLGLPETEILIGTVGRMQPWKGHHLFLQMAHQVSERLPDAGFLIVGGRVFAADADYEQQLRRLAAELGIAERVVFAGQQADVAPWFAAMDIFVHCSSAEPFGRVVVEAMAAGRPVVAFADGGVPEIVVEGETGYLVPPGSVEHLAAAVTALTADPALRAQMGQAGRRRVETTFSPQVHVRQIEAIYDEILSRKPCENRP
jgi:glycosyltransferase involved in cell wall biosynthesis